ncbi:MAG: histidine kinase [Bacteroidia bacterium]
MTLIQKLTPYLTVILIIASTALSNQLLAVQFPADFKADYAKAVHDMARIRILLEYSDKYGNDSITMLFADSALKLIEKNYNKGLNRKMLDEYKSDALVYYCSGITTFNAGDEHLMSYAAEGLRLARSLNDRQRIGNALLSYTDYYTVTSKLDSLKLMADTCIIILTQLKDNKNLAHAWCNLGNYYTGTGNSDSTIICFRKAYEYAVAAKDKNYEASTLYALGFGNIHKGNLKEALDYLYRSIKAYEEDNHPDDAYAALMYVGTVYNQLEEYNKAISFYQRSWKLATKKSDLFTQALLLNYMGQAYRNLSAYDSSIAYYQKTVEMARGINYSELSISALIYLGTNYLYKGDTTTGLYYLYQSVNENKELQLKENLAESYFNLGLVLFAKHKLDSAAWYAEQAEKLAASLGFSNSQKQVESLLSKVYESKGDFKKALLSFKKFIELRDSSTSNEAYRDALDKEFKYQADKKEFIAKAAQEKKDIQAREQRNKLIISLVAMAAIMVLGGFLFFVNRKRKEYKYRRNIAESEMKALRAQMNPHFMFNSLNAIQQMVLNNDNENAFNYLDTYSKLTRKILENSEKKWITVDDEIKFLELYLSIESLRFQNAFRYEIKVDDRVDIHYDKVPAMIVQPYVENAIRHGLFPKESNQQLLITFNKSGTNHLEITIEDNGVGRKKSSELKVEGNHHSMGMSITENRLRLLDDKNENSVLIEDLTGPDGSAAGTCVRVNISQSE